MKVKRSRLNLSEGKPDTRRLSGVFRSFPSKLGVSSAATLHWNGCDYRLWWSCTLEINLRKQREGAIVAVLTRTMLMVLLWEFPRWVRLLEWGGWEKSTHPPTAPLLSSDTRKLSTDDRNTIMIDRKPSLIAYTSICIVCVYTSIKKNTFGFVF